MQINQQGSQQQNGDNKITKTETQLAHDLVQMHDHVQEAPRNNLKINSIIDTPDAPSHSDDKSTIKIIQMDHQHNEKEENEHKQKSEGKFFLQAFVSRKYSNCFLQKKTKDYGMNFWIPVRSLQSTQ